MTNEIIINTDGGARGNPGPAAIGIVITKRFQDNNVTKEQTDRYGKYLGETTNNVAEYMALNEALEKVKNESSATIKCYLDSELVVKQLNGLYKVKDENLKKLFDRIKKLQLELPNITFSHIPRNQNKEADKIVNEVLDSISRS